MRRTTLLRAREVEDLAGALYADILTDDVEQWASLSRSAQEALLGSRARHRAPLADRNRVDEAVATVLARLRGLGALDPILDDPTVTEVMVNGDGAVWIERDGRVVSAGVTLDEETVVHLIERIVGPLGLRVDRSSPVVDARLPDGSRVNAIVRPVAVDGPCLTIRRFGVTAVSLAHFANQSVVELLREVVDAGYNVMVSGGTGAGKTTLLNALGACVDPAERVITIEDTAELHLDLPHVVRLEARPATAEGMGELTVRDLVRNVLRMRPDRLIVGEVRGGEALDMLQAMNTGHDGSLSTCHANSPADALRRLETMALMTSLELPIAAVREQLHSSVDVVVQVARDGSGRRRITDIAEVLSEPSVSGPATRPLVRGDAVVARPGRARRRVMSAAVSATEWASASATSATGEDSRWRRGPGSPS